MTNPTEPGPDAVCPECNSEVLPSQYCMMGHWCGEPVVPTANAHDVPAAKLRERLRRAEIDNKWLRSVWDEATQSLDQATAELATARAEAASLRAQLAERHTLADMAAGLLAEKQEIQEQVLQLKDYFDLGEFLFNISVRWPFAKQVVDELYAKLTGQPVATPRPEAEGER